MRCWRRSSLLLLLMVLAFLPGHLQGARVLLLAPLCNKSIKSIFYGMASALAERGHQVIFFNPYKPASPMAGVSEVVPQKLSELLSDDSFPNFFEMQKAGMQVGLKFIYNQFVEAPRAAIESDEFDQLLREHFDVVILGPYAYAFYSVPYLLGVPFAVLTPVAYTPMYSAPLGSPTLPALLPAPLLATTDRMSFIQRVKNVLVHVCLSAISTAQSWHADRLLAEKFGAGVVPPNAEIERNMSLLLQSSSPVIDYHRPLLPNVIEVGGLHCQPTPGPLLTSLRDFLGDSEFVYFSLGSVARPQDMPLPLRAAVLETLGSLPFQVLLKWDSEQRDGVPANVLPSRWLPQQDILAHPNCRLFISHGGFASLLESICHGVPLVVIPLTGDQQYNAANARRLGVGISLSWDRLTTATLTRAVHEALRPQLRAAAHRRRQLLAEQPVSSRQLAVHWVEQLVRRGGAPQLRSVGADLYWWQYYALDVAVFLLMVLLAVLLLLVKMLTCCRRCCGRGRSADRKTNKVD